MQRVDTKVIIRRLPPYLTEDDFKAIVDPLPPHRYFRFAPPDPSLQGLSCSTVYIHFSNPNALFQFVERFDGYVFVDSKGNEGVCYVERAMNQKTPALPSQIDMSTDNKRNTLHTRKGYQDFVVMYEKRKAALESGAEPYTAMEDSTGANADNRPTWEKNLEEIRTREKETAEGKYAQKSTLVEYMNDRFARLHADRDRRQKERSGKEISSSSSKSAATASDKQASNSASSTIENTSKSEKESSKKSRRNEKEAKSAPSGPLPTVNKPSTAKETVKKSHSGPTSQKVSADITTPDEPSNEAVENFPAIGDEEKRKKGAPAVDKSARPPGNRKLAEHFMNEYQAYYGRSNENSYGGYRGGAGGGKYRGSTKISQYWAPPPSEKVQQENSHNHDASSSTNPSKSNSYMSYGNDDYVEDERGNYFSGGKDYHSSWSSKDDYNYQHDDDGYGGGYYSSSRGGVRTPSYRNYVRGGSGGGQGFHRGGGPKRGGRGQLRGHYDGPPSYSASKRYES